MYRLILETTIMLEIITNYKQIDRNSWSKFVKHHPHGNVFQTPEMFAIYQRATNIQPYAIAAVKDGDIEGILVAQLICNGGKLAAWFTCRSIIIGGPLAKESDPTIIDELIKAYKAILPSKTIYSEIRPIYDSAQLFQQLSNKNWKRLGHYNIILPLNNDIDTLYNQMHKERKRNVQTAIKNGLICKEIFDPENIREIVFLIKKTYARKHVPISYLDMFEQVLKIIGDYAHFFACFTPNGKMIAGQLRLCYNEMVYAWFAGSDEEYLKLRPNDFLMWNVISWAKKENYTLFDFGGGGEPGVEYGVRDYKMKYGCEIYDYGRMQYLHRPMIYYIAQKAYKLYHKFLGK